MTTIYADNAATTQMSRAAIDAMLPYLETIYGNPSSLHSVGQQAAGALLSARDRIAKCLNASPREIYFTSGGSEADNQAILSAARLGERKGKKHIISTAFEHHAVLHTLKKLEKEGFTVELLPVGPIGTVTAQQVKRAIREDTCLVSVMYANNEIGSILPISAISAVCREAGVLFHTDAVQAAGHLPIDVKAQNIDLLSLSAHKFHGPKGTGALYARQGVFLTNLIEGGAQERGKRAGTENIPAIMGMAAALEDACAHLDENAKRVSALRDRLSQWASMDLGMDLGSLKIETQDVKEEDWAEVWKRFYKPFRAGKTLVVKPTWEHYDEQPGDKIIEIDPGMAFGSGTHVPWISGGLYDAWRTRHRRGHGQRHSRHRCGAAGREGRAGYRHRPRGGQGRGGKCGA